MGVKVGSKAPDGLAVIDEVLRAAGARPKQSDSKNAKNAYATKFAEVMASRIADDLSQRFRGIEASTKRAAGSVRGPAQLDINFSTPQYGLALGISLKSVHTRDVGGSHRYTHNQKRNSEELRIEAAGYHKRQPYAVMIGVLFLPFDSCDDAKSGASSFGSWVRFLRPYEGREDPEDEIDRFEKLYVALYEPDGTDLRFFDVASDPPKSGRPPLDGEMRAQGGRSRRLLSYEEFLESVHRSYLHRNHVEFRWADGEEASVTDDDTSD